MTDVKDFNHQQVGINIGNAKALVAAAFEAAGKQHPAPILMVALAMAYGIDSYGEEFAKWPNEVLDPWLKEMVGKISVNTVEQVLKLEGEGKAGSLRRERKQDHVGKEIPNV